MYTSSLSGFSLTVIRHPDYGNLDKEEFIWVCGCRGIKSPSGWDCGRIKELRDHILYSNHRAESMNSKWSEPLNSQSPSLSLVVYFLQEGHASKTSSPDTTK